VSPEEYARILLDPKDTEGIRQMILIHEAEADKKVRKKAKKTKRSG
jgi:ATP-dependent RNA helicase RhlE